MKAKISVILVILMFFTGFVSPASASTPASFTIVADLYLSGQNSAAGGFDISGLFTDTGAASEQFFIAADTIHGVKTLTGAEGTITVIFQAKLTWTGPTNGVAQGRFVILSGTGAYEKLHGVGSTYAELDLVTGHLLATYTGMAHFD